MIDRLKISDLPEAARGVLQGIYERSKAPLQRLIQSHGLRPGLSAAIAPERIAILENELRPMFPALEATGTAVACARGCGMCCTLTIDAAPDEVFALVDHLERNLPAPTVAEIKARAEAADARGHGLEPLARAQLQIACPVQDPLTMACLGYAARPTACQGYLSLDVKRCAAVHAGTARDVPQPAAANILTNVVLDARSSAFEDAGAPRQSLELTAALLAAWADPDAERRWLAGEAVLTEAASYQPGR